jgi:hypothetical protein
MKWNMYPKIATLMIDEMAFNMQHPKHQTRPHTKATKMCMFKNMKVVLKMNEGWNLKCVTVLYH